MLRGDGTLLFPVAFVADEDFVDAFCGMLFDVGEPGSDVCWRISISCGSCAALLVNRQHTVEAPLVRHIIYQ